MLNHPESQSSFYTKENLGFDLLLVEKGFEEFRPFFIGKNALELGPASGYMTRFLTKEFDLLTVVEGSESLLSQIPDYENLIKVHSLFEDYDPLIQFDTIIMNHVLEHIEKPELLLKKMKNWLNKDGVLIIGVPNAQSFHRLAAVHMGLLSTEYDLNERDRELGHYRVYDLDLLRDQVTNAGYTICAEGGIFVKFLSNFQIENLLESSVVDAYFKLAKRFYQNAAEIYLVLKR